jgi:hypothetical protein
MSRGAGLPCGLAVLPLFATIKQSNSEVGPGHSRNKMDNRTSYVTLSGVPLNIELRWPFHKSTSGGDFHVLHGVVTLADGSGLHANVSVHLSAAIQELLSSLDQSELEPVVISALRKWTDKKELEFIKSTKLQPLPLSSRFIHFKTKVWQFEDATDEQIRQLLKDQLYWGSLKTAASAPIAIADASDVLYTGATAERFTEAAQQLEKEGWASISGESFTPTSKIAAAAAEFETRAAKAFEAIQMKHAFEASKQTHT